MFVLMYIGLFSVASSDNPRRSIIDHVVTRVEQDQLLPQLKLPHDIKRVIALYAGGALKVHYNIHAQLSRNNTWFFPLLPEISACDGGGSKYIERGVTDLERRIDTDTYDLEGKRVVLCDVLELAVRGALDVDSKPPHWGGRVTWLSGIAQTPRLHQFLRLFILLGADLEQRDRTGVTALFAPIRKRDPEGLEILLDAGADPLVTSNENVTALYVATESRCVDCARMLLERTEGKDVNEGNVHGTPLILAIQTEDEEMLDLLLSYGADVDMEWGGTTAREYAEELYEYYDE